MKQILLVLVLAWYMVLKTADGGVSIGPYETLGECVEVLQATVPKLQDAGLKLTVARCVMMRDA